MNPNQPSREQIEARITALLLGELPAAEAELLRWTISQDASLQKLHDELQSTIVLVRAAVKPAADATAEKIAPLKLSDARRKELLAHFKTPRAKPSFWLRPIVDVPRLVTALALVAVVALLAAMLLPSLAAAKKKSQKLSAANYARMTELETRMRAEDNAASPPLPVVTLPAAGLPASAPATVTLAPEPALAPPPAQIVLPQAESASGLAAQTATPASPASGGFFARMTGGSKNTVNNSENYFGLPSTAPALPHGGRPQTGSGVEFDNLALGESSQAKRGVDEERLARLEKQTESPQHALDSSDLRRNQIGGNQQNNGAVVGVVNAFAGAGGFRNSGAAGGGGGGGGGGDFGGFGGFGGGNRGAIGGVGGASTPSQPVKSLSDGGVDKLGVQPSAAFDLQSDTAFAWHDSSANRPRLENKSENTWSAGNFVGSINSAGGAGVPGQSTPSASYEGRFMRQQAVNAPLNQNEELDLNLAPKPAATISGQDLAGLSAARAEERLPEIALNGVAGESAAERKLVEGKPAEEKLGVILAPVAVAPVPAESTVTAGGSLALNDRGAAPVPTRRAYRARAVTPLPGEDKTPVFGDVPVVGHAFQNSLADVATVAPPPAATPAPVVLEGGKTYQAGTTITVGGNLAFDDTKSSDRDQNVTVFKLNNAEPQQTAEMFQSGSRGIGSRSPTGALQQRAQTITAAGDNYFLGAAKDAEGAKFAFATTNAIALNDSAFSSGPSPTPTMEARQLQMIGQQPEAKENQPYYDAKRELKEKQATHELLYAKLTDERLDLELPKNSMVQITDRAEPAKSQNPWQKLTGEFESKARMKVENDVNDIQGFNPTPPSAGSGYDPYFVQTTAEIMKSDAVLGKVVDALKLDESWSKKNGGEKLTKHEVISQLKKRLDLKPVENTKLMEIAATSSDPNEAAQIANAVAKAYGDYRFESRKQLTDAGLKTLADQYAQQEKEIQLAQAKVDQLEKELKPEQADLPIRKPAPNAPVPQPEILCRENNFSTFSLNVSDVSFKLAAASLEKGRMPDAASIRSEEFINAFDYRDPEAAAGQPLAFASERARYPFAHNRDLLRFSVKTAAAGRQAGRALNLVLLLDTSGSMERADRVTIIREALRVLAAQLQPQDTVSVVTFARTARLWADGVPGDKAGETLSQVGGITPDGGTNLEEAMRLAYETARRHYLASGMNRVVLLTDGAANLGNVDPGALKQKVEAQRRQGIALDCFGIGWEDFNDDLLEQLSGNGDGRYAFINSPEDAGAEFAAKLVGALQVAAQDVKVQVEFNPQRVISWRQIGYAKHQLTKEQFRDNSVIAAEIAAQEAGNALYTVETKPDGIGPVATVRVRYRVPGTQDFYERSWNVEYTGTAPALEQSSSAMRLAATASAFSEWLAASPFAQEVSPDELLKDLSGVPQIYGADQRPAKLETMIREAKSVAGK